MLFFVCDIFNITFSKNTIRVSNCLDPDQDRHSVGPDLGPNCLQRLSADMSSLAKRVLKVIMTTTDNRFCDIFHDFG